MATAAQIAANQANAQHSTGPRTVEGRKRSSRNSTRHGMCGRDLVILPGDEDDFAQLLKNLSEELAPEGEIEELLFQQIVHGAWNLRRCRRAEAGLLNGAIDPLLDETNEAKLRRIDVYARRAQSEFSRAMKELKTLQAERHYRIEAQPPQEGEDVEQTMRSRSPLVDFCSIVTRLNCQAHRRNAAEARNLESLVHRIMVEPMPERTKPIAQAGGR